MPEESAAGISGGRQKEEQEPEPANAGAEEKKTKGVSGNKAPNQTKSLHNNGEEVCRLESGGKRGGSDGSGIGLRSGKRRELVGGVRSRWGLLS